MNFDKSNSPLWVKLVVWFIVFAFVAGALAIGITPLIQSWQSEKAIKDVREGRATEAAIEKIHLPGITVVEKSLEETSSASADVLTDLAIKYTRFAGDMGSIANDEKSIARFDELNLKAHEYWLAAYEKSPTKEIKGDLATSFYYIGDVDSAIKTAREIVAEYPDYATVWFNLGYYLSASDPEAAIEAFENAVKNDKDGTYTKDAQAQIDLLKQNKTGEK